MYILHSWPDSASLIVELVLQELHLPYQSRRIDRPAGALNSPEYRALHPLGLIPVMETPDGPVFETAAILLYLSEQHGLAPAPGSADRAAFLKWLFFTSSNLHTTLMQVYYPERTAGPDNTAAVVTYAKAKLQTYLSIMNDMAETRPSYLSDTQPTLLGYYLAVLMRWLASDMPSTDYPALHRVLTYLETRPATLACAAAEGLGPHPFTQG
jgi:glutathione S-transferase